MVSGSFGHHVRVRPEDLPVLIAHLDPVLLPGAFVFTTVDRVPQDVAPAATVCEDEGTTLILEKEVADRNGLQYSFVAARITLRVNSPLEAIGLTAAVSGSLAAAGISCNILAGTFHDHLYVPIARGEDAMRVLKDLADAAARDER